MYQKKKISLDLTKIIIKNHSTELLAQSIICKKDKL
ncbi:hypothetical protein THERMOT_2133 [Bathymodiolus thermophilus thioautotrophic gill symbiont]|nr:hypothetical protein THERMOT_2133 [Bathymodiolus thermophilus thioautotrophic gill symbiont]